MTRTPRVAIANAKGGSMHVPARLATCIALSAMTIAATTGSAPGLTLRFAPGGAIGLRQPGGLTTFTEFHLVNDTVDCGISIAGVLADEFTKNDGTDIVRVDDFTPLICDGGTITPLAGDLPWPLEFERIIGSLPSGITAVLVRIRDVRLTMDEPGTFNCLYQGNLGLSIAVRLTEFLRGVATYSVGAVTILETSYLTRTAGCACSDELEVRGSFSLDPGQTLTRIEGV